MSNIDFVEQISALSNLRQLEDADLKKMQLTQRLPNESELLRDKKAKIMVVKLYFELSIAHIKDQTVWNMYLVYLKTLKKDSLNKLDII